jgi:hypothetical protein
MAHAELPPVTEQHRQHAYLVLRPRGISFQAAMMMPQHALLRRLIEAKAHQLRTDAWMATQQRTVVPVRRCRPGADGHPIKWSTQMAMGDFEPVLQPDLYQ